MEGEGMRKRLLRLPSPAMVVALVALFVALTGSAAAVTVSYALNSDKVDGKHAVGAGATLNRAAGKLVATRSTGANKGKFASKFIPRDARWALVDQAGASIVAQSGGISITSHPFTGEYILEFGTSLIGKGIFVTPSGRDNTLPGGFWAAPCGATAQSYPNCSGQPTSRLHVLTEDTSGVAANQSFYVIVVN
jgi:hypothetical protein